MQINTNNNKTNIKTELIKWTKQIYNPNYFLTIQLPENIKNSNLLNSISHLRNIMLDFERTLLGRRWNKKHLPFIAFAELGATQCWHFHLFFNSGKFEKEKLDIAILKATIKNRLPKYSLQLEKIEDSIASQKVHSYAVKEIKVLYSNKIDSDRIILSHALFNINTRQTTPINQKLK